jgi:hypothetical protein
MLAIVKDPYPITKLRPFDDMCGCFQVHRQEMFL